MSLYTGFEGMSFNEYDFTEKRRSINNYCFDWMDRCASMFEYDVPEEIRETFKPEYMETYLIYYGHAAVFEYQGKLYASFGAWGGHPDPYYIPKDYIVSNPYLLGKGVSLNLELDKTCVVIKNTQHARPLKELFEKHATMLTENDISRQIAEFNARISDLLSAEDDKTRKSAELFLQRIIEGKLGVISSNAMLDSFKAYRQTAGSNTTLLPLIEHHQYIKAELLSDIGLDANWNGKREAVNSAETQLNKDYLMPLIDQMLLQRQEGLKKIKDIFGYDIKVRLSSSWGTNEAEEDAELQKIENEAEDPADQSEEVNADDDDSGTEETENSIQSV